MIEVDLPGARVVFTSREEGDVREAAGLTVVEAIAARPLARGTQVHGTRVRTVVEHEPELEEADGQVTTREDVAVMVQVADCLPVAIAGAGGVAMLHAGWRGLAGGVLEATVKALAVDPSTLTAWLGPAISRDHFEVGADVRYAFLGSDPGTAPLFAPNSRGRWQADLVGLARRHLERLGVGLVAGGHWCTYADRTHFYSYRRDGGGGRMAALIWKE